MVSVMMGQDNSLDLGVEHVQCGYDIFQVRFAGRARINDDEPLPADQIGVCPRPGHG
jgi:hypothetical protein